MSLANGQTFAGYTIIRMLGAGGMGRVYLAQHPRLPRRDALKLLPREWSADEDFRARFNREADLASTLWHPHIVGVHDRGEEDGQLWISMDFVDGLDAAQLLADRYPAGMPVEEVARIVTAVASALDYAHKQGLLHRDVKPANIMLTHLDDDGEQRILLTDFGIARNVNDISGLTATNMTVGTVAYCSPEQLLGEDMDGRADQYSLAATAFHLLSGSHLFPHSNPAVVISRHLNNHPPALAGKRPELVKVDAILAKGLAKQPDDRYPRCSDFARALSDQINSASAPTRAAPISSARAASTSPKDAVPSQDDSAGRRVRNSRMFAVTATVVVLIMAGLVAIWRPWERHAPPGPQESTGPTTSLTQVPPPVTTTTALQPPPPPTFSPKAIDQVLLTADQLSKVLGTTVTSDPAAAGGGTGALAMNSSSYGMSDHSGQVTPRSCVGLVFTGEHDVYAASQPTEIKTQQFGNLYRGGPDKGPHLLEQTVAVYPTAAQAQDFLTTSQSQWNACVRSEVDATLGYENGAGYALSTVQRQGNLITVSMATNGGENGPDACQQALGIHENVIVETRTCQVPNLVSNFDPVKGWPRDPSWAVPDAERVAKAMLENVRP
ncbi:MULTISPECIES: serine/threonine-protein kinase PknH/PknJ [Mycobacterium avium complex (MAC)]|uniref:non-specific serine/threonine protein kinase n=2 Tax=Mycobacterium avium complex (MAC) TaxID=120793 RepID=J9W903_MYCIP|nr:Serine/threonine-protein kinase pknF [Mycobacterium intracellulare subsp. intracellulare MTCC 9506]BCO51222.1 serine/threonine protein kinase [Mycobacterium paraintracellulare]BCO88408.1 serine/threonine protein kinase [Mycobacterium paraintracellulare]